MSTVKAMTNVVSLFDAARMACATDRALQRRELYWERTPSWRTADEVGANLKYSGKRMYGCLASFNSDVIHEVGPVSDELQFWRTAYLATLQIPLNAGPNERNWCANGFSSDEGVSDAKRT